MSDDYVNNEVPGLGDVRARVGTSTAELAGAAKFWHEKSKVAWRNGFACAVSLCAAVAAIATYVLHTL